jgi:hypothetical protein
MQDGAPEERRRLLGTASSYYHHPNPKMPAKHYRGQIDFFGVYCVETGGVYFVPIDALAADHPRVSTRRAPHATTSSRAFAGRATTRSEPSL